MTWVLKLDPDALSHSAKTFWTMSLVLWMGLLGLSLPHLPHWAALKVPVVVVGYGEASEGGVKGYRAHFRRVFGSQELLSSHVVSRVKGYEVGEQVMVVPDDEVSMVWPTESPMKFVRQWFRLILSALILAMLGFGARFLRMVAQKKLPLIQA